MIGAPRSTVVRGIGVLESVEERSARRAREADVCMCIAIRGYGSRLGVL
jgi:hypothetical protein